MEPGGSSPHSQQPATCHYPEPDWSSPCSPSNPPKIHFNIILPSNMQRIYTYIPETNHVPREYSVAATLVLLFIEHIWYYYYYYLLQLGFHPVAAVLHYYRQK
jgi:hypothetical protein